MQELITLAKPLIGQKLSIKAENFPETLEYTFTNIGDSIGVAESGQPKSYTIFGKLVSSKGDIVAEPLSKIIDYFNTK